MRDEYDVLPAIARVGGVPVIIKLLEGTQGVGVILAETSKVAEAIIQTLHSAQQNVLIQKFVKESKGADIRPIAAAVDLLTGVPALALVAPVGAGVALVEVVVPYPRLARYLKLLTLVIFAYVVGAFSPIQTGARRRRPPSCRSSGWTRAPMAAIVAILGTTISPYLFFWQTSEEVIGERDLLGVVILRPHEMIHAAASTTYRT